MAFDLMGGKITGKSWARGDIQDWALARAVKSAGEKVPWKLVGGVAAGIVGVILFWPKRRNGIPEPVNGEHTNGHFEPTKKLPVETMEEVVFERRR